MSRMALEDRVGAAALSLVEVLAWNGSDASCVRLEIWRLGHAWKPSF